MSRLEDLAMHAFMTRGGWRNRDNYGLVMVSPGGREAEAVFTRSMFCLSCRCLLPEERFIWKSVF
jgi:hypothetical protein